MSDDGNQTRVEHPATSLPAAGVANPTLAAARTSGDRDFAIAAFDSFAVSSGGLLFEFRSHPEVVSLRKHFSKVVLTSVNIAIIPSTVSVMTQSLYTRLLRFGMCPRTITLTAKDDDDHNVSTAQSIPRLKTNMVDAAHPSLILDSCNRASFPPGLELDFGVVETRAPYAAYVVALINPSAAATSVSIGVQFDFVVSCSGESFGIGGL